MREIPVEMNAARVCNAIARIGYEPHSALMDIIDNSVAAEALNVKVEITLVEGKTLSQRTNVARYRIVDDGNGLNEKGIENAFQLGSYANYKPNSLSKYGMGLKSAGFSLGTRIQMISKKDGKLSEKYFLDRKVIEAKNEYVVICEDLTPEERTEYEILLSAKPSGTVVEISDCGDIYHTSARTTIEKLTHCLGVTYFPFLSAEDESKRLNITLTYPGAAAISIKPMDILFSDDALAGFDPTTYDATVPCYAFKENWIIPMPGAPAAPPIKLEVVTFPKAAMATSASPLSAEQKEKISSYKVSRENKGFFVYRNGRLIRWGDDLGEIIPRDLLGLRARMELTTEHDDFMHVDVSKQHLGMDDETRSNLETLMRLPRKQAKQIFEFCDTKLNIGAGEGMEFSSTADSVPEDDPIEGLTTIDAVERKQRAKVLEAETKAVLEDVSIKDTANSLDGLTQEEVFKKVRYTDVLSGTDLWSTQKDTNQGTFVLINRRHSFYKTVLSNFDDAAPERLALEAIIFCCAVGENKTYENLTEIKDDDIRRVIGRYHTVLSFNLGEWANGNQHLFEK